MNTNPLQKVIDLIKSGELAINLSFRTVTKATKLMKKYALATKTTNKDLVKLFREDNAEFWRRLNDYIADEYNEEKDEYGDVTLKLFALIKEITGTSKAIEDIQLYELVELVQGVAAKIQEEQTDNFLQQEDTQLATTTKQLSIIESEKKSQKKEKVKS
jgi:hypothetical protein